MSDFGISAADINGMLNQNVHVLSISPFLQQHDPFGVSEHLVHLTSDAVQHPDHIPNGSWWESKNAIDEAEVPEDERPPTPNSSSHSCIGDPRGQQSLSSATLDTITSSYSSPSSFLIVKTWPKSSRTFPANG